MAPARVLIAFALLGAPPAAAVPGDAALFDAERDGAVLALVGPSERDSLSAALADAGRNWVELATAIQSLEGEERVAAVWLVNGMPHLDRLEMTSAALVEHVVYAFRAREGMPYPVRDDMFRPYILTYRIEDEPVEAWRKTLFERYAPVAARKRTAVETARALSWDIAESVSQRERQFFGPRQSPLETRRCGGGSEAEIAIFACAVMKALGIPSRQASVPALGEERGARSWIEIHDGDGWLPYYPLEPAAFGDPTFLERGHPTNVSIVTTRSSFEETLVTEAYTATGTIEVSISCEGRPAASYEHFSISVLNDGSLVPLDALGTVTDGRGHFRATLGDGRYVVCAGSRNEEGDPFVSMREVVVAPGETASAFLDVTPGGPGVTPAGGAGEGALILSIVLDLREEPSARMLPLIGRALTGAPAGLRVSCALRDAGPDDPGAARDALGGRAAIVALPVGARSWTSADGGEIIVRGDETSLPIVRLCDREGGEAILLVIGYDLNVGERLGAAIASGARQEARP